MSRSVRSTAPAAILNSLAPNEPIGNGTRRPVSCECSSSGTTTSTRPASSAPPSRRAAPRSPSTWSPRTSPLPDPAGFDHVVVLGAISSVNDADAWIADELAWLRRADGGRRAHARHLLRRRRCAPRSAARWRPWTRKEIGWTLVDSLDHGVIPVGPWLEFHGDRCLLPADGDRAGAQRRGGPGVHGSAGTWRSSSTPRSTARSSSAGWTRGGDRGRGAAGARPRPVPGRHHPRGAGRAGAGGPAGRRRAGPLAAIRRPPRN